MKSLYSQYRALNLDLSVLGLADRAEAYNYFCTPKGARIIGWAGVDGIHFCFIRGFGEMVFAVSPMRCPGDYVHPVAKNFNDFLRLLLACHDTAALEQACDWDEHQFRAFIQAEQPTTQQQAVLDALAQNFRLSPIEQPFSYLRELQIAFDYSRIKFSEDDMDVVPSEPTIPEWKVYFSGNFWGHPGRERAGKELPLGKQFVWGEEKWLIPACYICSKGLVVDLCAQIPAAHIQAFMQKWNLNENSKQSAFCEEECIQIETENPLHMPIQVQAQLNGHILSTDHGCGLSWNPCLPEYNTLEAKSVLAHYQLDAAYGWVIWRYAFAWKSKRKPHIHNLMLLLQQEPIPRCGIHFQVSETGQKIRFCHPSSGVEHCLRVVDYQQQEMQQQHFGTADMEYPTHYTMLSYTLSPDLPNSAFSIVDCLPSEQPRRKHSPDLAPQASDCVLCTAIIGGADGPTSIFLQPQTQEKLHAACSALHFQPVSRVEWRMVFYERQKEDCHIPLL